MKTATISDKCKKIRWILSAFDIYIKLRDWTIKTSYDTINGIDRIISHPKPIQLSASCLDTLSENKSVASQLQKLTFDYHTELKIFEFQNFENLVCLKIWASIDAVVLRNLKKLCELCSHGVINIHTQDYFPNIIVLDLRVKYLELSTSEKRITKNTSDFLSCDDIFPNLQFLYLRHVSNSPSSGFDCEVKNFPHLKKIILSSPQTPFFFGTLDSLEILCIQNCSPKISPVKQIIYSKLKRVILNNYCRKLNFIDFANTNTLNIIHLISNSTTPDEFRKQFEYCKMFNNELIIDDSFETLDFNKFADWNIKSLTMRRYRRGIISSLGAVKSLKHLKFVYHCNNSIWYSFFEYVIKAIDHLELESLSVKNSEILYEDEYIEFLDYIIKIPILYLDTIKDITKFINAHQRLHQTYPRKICNQLIITGKNQPYDKTLFDYCEKHGVSYEVRRMNRFSYI
jgi:hypothetical protein